MRSTPTSATASATARSRPRSDGGANRVHAPRAAAGGAPVHPGRLPLVHAQALARDAPLNFEAGDKIVELAERQNQLLFGAHLVWDEGFGDGWGEDEMFYLSEREARDLLFGTVEAVVRRYKGRVAGWIVVNEAIGNEGKRGMRIDVPWYQTIGRSYVAESFRLVRSIDPDATLVLNEFGFETVNEFGDRPGPRRRAR